jgi:hypothetical protein
VNQRALRDVDPGTFADYTRLFRLARTRMSAMSDADIIRYRRLQQTLSIRARAAIEKAAQ